MILVHAGGWAGHDGYAQSELLKNPGDLFLARGWRVVSIDYEEGTGRRAGSPQRRRRRARARLERRSAVHLRRVLRRAPGADGRREAARDRLRHRRRHADRPVPVHRRGLGQQRRPRQARVRPDHEAVRHDRRGDGARGTSSRSRPRSTPTCCSCTRPTTSSSRRRTPSASRPPGPTTQVIELEPGDRGNRSNDFMHGTVSDARPRPVHGGHRRVRRSRRHGPHRRARGRAHAAARRSRGHSRRSGPPDCRARCAAWPARTPRPCPPAPAAGARRASSFAARSTPPAYGGTCARRRTVSARSPPPPGAAPRSSCRRAIARA